MTARRSAIVVGAGIIGLATAWELLRRGWTVTVVEQNPGPGQGSTTSSLGIVRFHAASLEAAALAVEGFGWWQHWHEWLGLDDDTVTPAFRSTGSLVLDLGDGYVDSVALNLGRLAVPYLRWSLPETARRFPFLDLRRFGGDPHRPDGYLDGALFTPGSGYVTDPALAAGNVALAFAAAGGSVHYRRRVVGIQADSDRLVSVRFADGGTLTAAAVVCVAGPQTRRLLELADVLGDFTVVPAPLRHDMYLARLEAVPGGAAVPHLVDDDLRINFRPEGPTGFLGGLEQPPGTVGDPRSDGLPSDERPASGRYDEVMLRLGSRVPAAGFPMRPTGVVGFYDVTPDWTPVYDRTAMPGLFVAAGTSGSQLKTAPFVGALMAELVTASADGRDHDAAPVVVSGRYVDHQFDLRYYSRRRPVPAAAASHTING